MQIKEHEAFSGRTNRPAKSQRQMLYFLCKQNARRSDDCLMSAVDLQIPRPPPIRIQIDRYDTDGICQITLQAFETYRENAFLIICWKPQELIELDVQQVVSTLCSDIDSSRTECHIRVGFLKCYRSHNEKIEYFQTDRIRIRVKKYRVARDSMIHKLIRRVHRQTEIH